MDIDSIKDLASNIDKAIKAVNPDELKTSRDKLKKQSEEADFWQDNQKASKVMQQLSSLEQNIEKWESLKEEIKHLSDLSDMNDPALENDIKKQFSKLKNLYDGFSRELAYDDPYDKNNVVMSIHAGAGGTDAQDWASMLLRMYLRWAEANGFKTKIIDESPGEEAGIKSVSLEILGQLAYGKLKGEHGVHRLVRLSPFNANNLRQTSFAKVEILPEIDEPGEVPIDEKDLKIDVFRAGGHGGQSVNTTDSAVRVTHIPTGIAVSIQNERSQLQNKDTALTILRSRLAQLKLEQHKETIEEIKGPNQANEWGSQIRSYVLHPYNMVKDLRTKHETSNTQAVLDGDINGFIEAFSTKNINN